MFSKKIRAFKSAIKTNITAFRYVITRPDSGLLFVYQCVEFSNTCHRQWGDVEIIRNENEVCCAFLKLGCLYADLWSPNSRPVNV